MKRPQGVYFLAGVLAYFSSGARIWADLGFSPEPLTVVQVPLLGPEYRDPERGGGSSTNSYRGFEVRFQ
jgi:hypothetical protein